MITQKPDLVEALNEFIELEKKSIYWNKHFTLLPEIKCAKLTPLLYDSIYNKESSK